jgi:uncharacterized protein
MTGLPIPLEALEDCGAILGRRGAGKSGTRTLLLEHELDRGRRCCLIDPKGDSWGIRLNPDGSPSRFQDVPIFGGQHGDLQLDDSQGVVLGELVATHDLSCVLDLSGFSVAGMRRFMRDFAAALFDKNRAALTLFVDEADQLAPQRLPAEMAMLLHHMESLIRQGRQRGILMWMLTQRPQILNKNLLSQAESLVAMRMSTPHDRGAIRDWMEAHDPEQAKRVEATLAQLAVGEAWTWVPAADFLERVQFPLFSTFDSMRTPRHGEKVAEVKLAAIDISAIAEALGTAAGGSRPKTRERTGTIVDHRLANMAEENSRLRGELDALQAELGSKKRHLVRCETALQEARRLIDRALAGIDTSAELAAELAERKAKPTRSEKQTAGEDISRPGPARGATPAAAAAGEAASHTASPGELEEAGGEREYRALAALAAIYPSGLTEAAWAARAGYARKGGAWIRRRKRYMDAGLIRQDNGRWFATDAGVAQVGDELPALPAPGPELVDWWARRLGAPGRLLRILAGTYPRGLKRDALAAEAGMAVKGGAFIRHVAALKAADLVAEHGKSMAASPAIMVGS